LVLIVPLALIVANLLAGPPGQRTAVNGTLDVQLNRFLPVGADALYTVERPAVLDGRLADPALADEAVVTPDYVRRFGLGVGDTVRLGLYAPGTIPD
jgi:hypothetical protein